MQMAPKSFSKRAPRPYKLCECCRDPSATTPCPAM